VASNPRIVSAPGAQEGGGKGIPTWVWYAGGAVVGVLILLFVIKPGSGSGTPIQNAPSGSGGGPSLSDWLSLWAQAQQNGGGAITTSPPGTGPSGGNNNPSSGWVSPYNPPLAGAAQTPSNYTPWGSGFGGYSASQSPQRFPGVGKSGGFGGVSASQATGPGGGPVLPPQPANRQY
jgi:hypothetical protein